MCMYACINVIINMFKKTVHINIYINIYTYALHVALSGFAMCRLYNCVQIGKKKKIMLRGEN